MILLIIMSNNHMTMTIMIVVVIIIVIIIIISPQAREPRPSPLGGSRCARGALSHDTPAWRKTTKFGSGKQLPFSFLTCKRACV